MRFFGAHREAGTEILPSEGRLPPFEGATGWLNSEPLTPEGLRGRVVAVQFWTYTCVNWLRTLPYVREWAAKYHDQGLSVIGVHTPEFGFERNVDNVIAAAKDMRVDYPIALDSDYAVWRAFANHFWPALYIADEQGQIRYHHFGEGEYAMSEMVIQQLLGEAGKEGFDPAFVSVDPQGTEVAADWSNVRTPETYLSYGRSYGFASADGERFDEPHDYPEPSHLSLNEWAPSGDLDACRARGSARRGTRTDCDPLPCARREPRDGTRQREGPPCRFACSSTDSRRAPLTELTSTSRATARSANSASTS